MNPEDYEFSPRFNRVSMAARGIPTPHRLNQRQRRKLHRQVRPHGWKGGAK